MKNKPSFKRKLVRGMTWSALVMSVLIGPTTTVSGIDDPSSIGGVVDPALATVCGGNSTNLNLSGHTGTIVRWQLSTDDGGNWTDIASTNSSLDTNPLTQTTQFRAVVQNDLGEEFYSTAAIVVVETVRAQANFTAIACRDGTSVVTVSASGGTSPYAGTGEFSAAAGLHSYTVTDASGCSDTVRVDIPEPTTALVVQAGASQEIYAGSSALLGGDPTASGGGAAHYTYLWSPATGLNDPTLPNCTAMPEQTTEYTVTVTDANGCTASASVLVVVSPLPAREPLGPSSRRTPIIFSEIMYEPAPSGETNLAFIEIYNSNPWFEDISGYRILGDGMNYTIPAGTVLASNAFLVIAASPGSLEAVFSISNVLGPYVGNLKRSCTLRLLDEQGAELLNVPYSNLPPWPVGAAGAGHSIVLASPTYGEADPRAWELSDLIGGSPGKAEAFHPSPLGQVRINEILAHSEDPSVPQFIELYNRGTLSNDLSGCILTDDPAIHKFVIPAGTWISPGAFVSFSETGLGFNLNGAGSTIYFIKPDGKGILDALQFDGQADRVSSGRWPDGAAAIYSLLSRTPGTNNSEILIGEIVINELMYHPISDNDDEQYVELFNKGTNPISLANWKFVAGISFTFPADTTLAPNDYLVIARNLTNLLAKYPNLNSGNALGNYGGKLSHKGERVALARPDTLTATNAEGGFTTNLIYVVEDEVTYATGGRWGNWADGRGTSLELIDPQSNHRLAANWGDSDERQKSEWVTIETTGVLDHGVNYDPSIQHAQIGLLDVGECLIDDLEVLAGTNGPNLVSNPDFEAGLGGWSLLGDHSRSSLEAAGTAGSQALHIRCSDQMWTAINSCEFDLNPNTLAEGQVATLRFKARWLRGWPEPLLRLNGNWLEATGRLPVPPNLGTPGLPNSLVVTNAGPAVYEVVHAPVLPAAEETVLVTARAHDADGIESLVLHYRLDPAPSGLTVTMNDQGTDGDAISGDGIFTAAVPGQSSNTLVAFYITATDSEGGVTRFPALLQDNSPARECLVMFGATNSAGSFGAYHIWITQTNARRWTELLFLSNEAHDCTFVNGTRIIYNAQGQFQGSPAKQDTANTPDGALCNYKLSFPDDDLFLGATSINPLHQPGNAPGDDPTLQREQAANLLLRELGLPWIYRRYVVVYVNGTRRGLLMEDAQRPNKDMVEQQFANDPDGWLYKMQSWAEFASEPDSNGYMDYKPASSCNLMPYTTTGGRKKTARYRWNFLVRRTPDSANNFDRIYALVDAAGSYGTAGYLANMEQLADMENWMRNFAANHAAGNWDSFGAANAQNMYSYFGALGTKCTLLNYDFNIVFGNVNSWKPGEHLFTTNPEDPNTANFYREPVFRRMYWRALKELVNGPLDLTQSGPWLDARHQVFVANGFQVEDPNIIIKPWMSAARSSIASQLAAEDTTNFTANLSIVISNGIAEVSGSAPVDVKAIWFNGIEVPITWTGLTNWTARMPVEKGTNQFSVVGVDIHGRAIACCVDSVTAINEVPEQPSLTPGVVINEIMFHPGLADGEYVELYNASSNLTFDLSGFQLLGLSYTFPSGSLIEPGNFLVLAADRAAFASAYGATIPVFDTFGGKLPMAAGTLSLVDTNGLVVTQVRYQSESPWPTNACGTWASLQLIDPLQDNWRAGNWAAIDPNQNPAHWSYYSVTGGSSSSILYIYPLAQGDIYLDDLKLVSGSVAEAGPNLLANGDFESGLPEAWSISANLANSTLSTTVRHSGNSSLHLIASAGGATRGSAIYQDIFPTLPPNEPYTLSFWCLPGTHPPAGGLVIRLAGSGIAINVNPLPPSPNFGLCTPGTTNSVAATLPSFHPLWINEIQPDNGWLEIYNPSTNTISLNGLCLANSYDNLGQWPFPPDATIAPGEFKVIFADGLTNLSTADELHASFTLSSGSGTIALSRLYNNQLQVVDFLDYTNLTANYSCGSFPNGQSFKRQTFFVTTPGSSNTVVSLPPLSFIPYETAGSVYSQSFDGLPNPGAQSVNTGNPITINGVTYSLANPFGFASPIIASGNAGGLGIATLAGWYGMSDPASSAGARFGATYGDQTTGGVLSFGLPNDPNRALGLLATSSTGSTAFGARFVNQTDRTLTRMTLQFTGALWRQSNLPKNLRFYYLVDPAATAGFSTNYTSLVPSLNVSFPTSPTAVGGVAIDGTSPLNQTNLGVVNYPIDWPPGAALWLTWQMVDPAGKAQGLGLDNLMFWAAEMPIGSPVRLMVSQDTAANITFSWPTLVGQSYQLEYNDNLNTTGWIALGEPVDGTGGLATLVSDMNATNRFFRLKQILP